MELRCKGRNSSLLVTGSKGGDWLNICDSSSACYYHVLSLDMRKVFAEVSLASDGGRYKGTRVSCVSMMKMTFTPRLLSLFPTQLHFPGHILRVSSDDSADCIPCMSHLKGKGDAGETIRPGVIKMLFGNAEKDIHLDA